MTNDCLTGIYQSIQWQVKPVKGKRQCRLLPKYRTDKDFKRQLRDQLLADWQYSAHWVDSALKTAFSIMQSWRTNYLAGRRKRHCPQATRLFARVKQTLIQLQGTTLRISLRPREFVVIDLSQRYFKLPHMVSATGVGEPILTPTTLYLPIHTPEENQVPPGVTNSLSSVPDYMAWDSNMPSLDGFHPKYGWVQVDTRPLMTVHISAFEKRRSIQRKAAKSKKARCCQQKYRKRERCRARNHQQKIVHAMTPLATTHGVEKLTKERMYRRSRTWNRRLMRTDWRKIHHLLPHRELPAYYTSKTCSVCGYRVKDLRGARFHCPQCGIDLDRQLNAAINLYLKMEGVPPHPVTFFRRVMRPFLRSMKKRKYAPRPVRGGYVQTGAKRKATNEPVRLLHEAMTPQFYIRYNADADVYRLMSTNDDVG